MVLGTQHAEPGLMHERRRLQRLVGTLLSHPMCGKLAEFFVDERKQFLASFRITLSAAVHKIFGP